MRATPEQDRQADRRAASINRDELGVLLDATDQRRAYGRKLLAALITDERIDIAFRAGLLMSLGAQR